MDGETVLFSDQSVGNISGWRAGRRDVGLVRILRYGDYVDICVQGFELGWLVLMLSMGVRIFSFRAR